MIDDHSRLVYTELLSDEQAPTVTAFGQRALAFYASHGISAERLQTDNHFSYAENRALRELLAREGIHHRFIPPRTPKAQWQGRADISRPRPRVGLWAALPAQVRLEPTHYRSG